MIVHDIHNPVMTEEIIKYLNLKPGKTVIDCTVGAGGHSLNIAERILPTGRIVGIDQDKEILEKAKQNLSRYENNIDLIYGNFRELKNLLNDMEIHQVDGILYDLGISSYQLDKPERGFSFNNEGPLDMRMDRNLQITAFDLINNLPKDEISKILYKYADERYSRKIASSIVKHRQKQPISTTKQLEDIVKRSIPYRGNQRINPATRTFLALRIAVNNELESLDISLTQAIDLLKEEGRICVISFHSQEDRIVKHKFKEYARKKELKILTKKPLRPKGEEIEKNPRSRSAKLRAAMKVV
jgi:16S rRNA (cytosine1402-N4)-methyltransferase